MLSIFKKRLSLDKIVSFVGWTVSPVFCWGLPPNLPMNDVISLYQFIQTKRQNVNLWK